MKMKRSKKGLIAALLATVLCTVGIVGYFNSEKIFAYIKGDNAETIWSKMTKEEQNALVDAYDGDPVKNWETGELIVKSGAVIDMVNGERVLTAEQKANVLTNIYKNKEKLTILEIVPYKLASTFNILMPNNEQRKLVEAYGDEIFSNFGNPYTIEPCRFDEKGSHCDDQDTRLLTDGWTLPEWDIYVSYDKKYQRGVTSKITNEYQPIQLHRDGTEGNYTYSAYMPNYYLFNLLKGYESTNLYKYFIEQEHCEVITVTPAELNADPSLLNSYLDRTDKVDLIYVAGYAENTYEIYRNIFMNTPVSSDASERQNMIGFIKDGTNADSFKSGVYYKDGSDYKEYTISELVDNKVWYDSYIKVGDSYYYNDINWENVDKLINYIFGQYNTNYIYTETDDDGNIVRTEHQRIPAMIVIPTFDRGWFSRSGAGIDNNIGKLYYLLVKSTDQTTDLGLCTLCGKDDYGTHTPADDIKTCYYDPDYFYKKYFDTTDGSGNKYTFDNGTGTTTAAHNGNKIWKVAFSDNPSVRWQMVAAEKEVMYGLEDTFETSLFYTCKETDGSYIVHNSVVGILTGKKLMLTNSQTWSAGGTRAGGVYNRLEDAIGDVFTQYNITNYFLGVDETEFLEQPDATFPTVDFEWTEGGASKAETVETQMTSNGSSFITYLYDDTIDYDKIIVNYQVTDESKRLVEAKLVAHYKVGGTAKDVVIKEYSKDDVYGNELVKDSFSFTKDSAPELYEAFKNNTLYFTFSAKNEYVGKKKTYNKSDIAYIFFRYRNLYDLD